MDYDENDEHVDEGSAWTSNSDLFMVLAIVFLFLFIFTLLKASMTTLQSRSKIEDIVNYQKAKVPAAARARIKNFQKNLDDGLSRLDQQKASVDRKLQELAEFQSEMKQHRQHAKKMIDEFSLQQAMLANANQTITKQESQIKDIRNQERHYKTQSKANIAALERDKSQQQKRISQHQSEASQLKASLQEITSKHRQNFALLVKNHNETLTQAHQARKEAEALSQMTKKRIHDRDAKIEVQNRVHRQSLQDEQKKHDAKVSHLIAQHTQVVNALKSTQKQSIKALRSTQQQSTKVLQSQQSQEMATIKSSYADKMTRLSSHQRQQSKKLNTTHDQTLRELQSMYQKRVDTAQEKSAHLAQKVAAQSKKFASLEIRSNEIERALEASNEESKTLSSQLNQSHKSLHQERGAHKETRNSLTSNCQENERDLRQKQHEKLKRLTKELTTNRQVNKDLDGKLKQEIRSRDNLYRQVDKLRKLKSKIGQHVSNTLKASGIAVHVDPNTGTIILDSEQFFRFSYNSYALEAQTQQKLKELIPVYAESLFGDSKIAKLIEGVTISGHASPRYQRQTIDPKTAPAKAYLYNLELSLNRAKQVFAFTFGDEIGEFRFKSEFKRLASVSGHSFSRPIQNPNPKSDTRCAPWDCAKSRRVEIAFKLKESQALQEAIDRIKGH